VLGLVGLGRIGQSVALRAHAGFGMRLIAYDPYPPAADRLAALGVEMRGSIEAVLEEADFVSIHCPATPENRHLINAARLKRMKPGAYLINTARGSVVDEAALEAAVRDKGIRAGLDVYQNEPAGSTGQFGNPIVQSPGVYGTHQVGASTEQAQVAIAHEVIRIVQSFKATGEVPNVVNRLARSSASHVLVIRHRNRPGARPSWPSRGMG
jgi:D-3-phosphoglycerate dehydrogenase / 2-oxoglutarate reductase